MIFVKLNQDNKVIERGFGNVIPDGCVEDNGQYEDCNSPPPEEIVVLNVKNTRNNLLQQSDWTQIPNCPLTDAKQQEWAIYRQELRDISSQSGYPFNVIWPVKPE